jgi:SAM-dependent MidA family methyltransferase
MPHNIWLIEIWAHRGYLLADMIQWLFTCDPLLIESMNFGIVERQPQVRKIQSEYFQRCFADAVSLAHFTSLEEVKVPYAFFVSNEIFDAFACELYNEGKKLVVENHSFRWEEAGETLDDFARRHRLKRGEIAVGYEEFARRVSDAAGEAEFVTFDYGERYVRNDFSVRIYRHHETFPLFDEAVELERVFQNTDITYDVNFNHLIEAFEAAGFSLVDYETQARALVRFGIIDILGEYAAQADHKEYVRHASGVKTLISPTMMGDRFKMLHMHR